MAVLVSEVSSIYESLLGGGNLLSSPHQLADFILPFNELDRSKDLQFWRDELKNAPQCVNLPLDFERPEFRTYESHRLDYKLNTNLVEDLQKIAAKNRLSYYQILFAGFKAFVASLSGQRDLVIGISSALQSSFGKSDLVGHLVQMLPIRSNIEDVPFLDYAQILKTKMLNAVDHSKVTFGEIIGEIELERDPSKIPLMNIIFNVDQQYPDQGFEFKRIEAKYESNPRAYENFEIFINATTLSHHCILECQYNTNLFRKETIQRWLVEFENFLFQVTKNPRLSFSVKRSEISTKSSKDKSPKVVEVSSEENFNLLKKLWSELLGTSDLDETSNFFDKGGHSLLAMDLSHRLKREFNQKISVKQIMLNPLLGTQSNILERAEEPSVMGEIKNFLESDITGEEFDLSFSQKQSWFVQTLNPSSSIFNVPSAIRIKSNLDINRLKLAYKKLLKFHPQLRSTFIKGPRQRIQTVEEVFSEIDFTIYQMSLSDAVKQMNKLAQTAKDLSEKALFTLKIYQLNDADYILFNCFHHINFDGWSFDLFFDHLNKSYTDQTFNSEGRSYKEYVDEQSRKLNSDQFQSRVTEFAQGFKNNDICLYPSDKERPKVMSFDASTIPFEFSEVQIDFFQNFSKRHGVSLFNIFISAFAKALLKRIDGPTITLGTPLRARPSIEDRGTIGYFVNSLPVLLKNASSPREFLQGTQKQLLETLENEDIPLESLVRELGIKRDTSKTALFQQLFSFQEVSNREGVFDGHKYTQVNIAKASTHTDIDMWIKASQDKIEGAIEYRKDLYENETIANLLQDFFEALDWLTKEESVHYASSQPESVVQAVEKFAEKTPLRIALTVGDRNFSYFDLNKMANEKAEYFQSKGIKPGSLVGLCSERDEFLLASLLGLMKIGAGYVPLDPYFPNDRLFYMIEHSQVEMLLISTNQETRFEKLNKKMLLIDQSHSHLKGEYQPGYNNQNTLYVIYTSGSTGKPKGVEVNFEAVNNLVLSMHQQLSIGPQTNLLAITTLSFDISVLELYVPLFSGGSLYLADKFQAIDGHELASLIRDKNINTMQGTPASFRLLLAAEFEDFSNFKVICGGEPFPLDLAKTLLAKNAQVWNAYGPTETTVWSLIKKLEEPLEKISIGKPILNTQVFILDEKLQKVENGTVGELCIGGVGLSRGYYKDPEKTSKAFIHHPQFGKIYRTGDLARTLEDGEYECLGRNDSQVKIRGYRIELGEIENTLNSHPKINQVAVVVKEHSNTDKRLLAFYSSSEELSDKSLKEYLTQTLPNYMIPNHFYFNRELPLTLNGKIDKKSLSESVNRVEALPAGISSSREKLAKIWSDLLGQDPQSDEDNFFESGGHSLLAVDLFSRLEKEFDLELNLSDLITKANFSDILKLIEAQSTPSEKFQCLVPITETSSKKNLFCIHGVGGNILNYLPLKNFTGRFSLIGVQSYGVNGELDLPESIEGMASKYTEEILRFQKTGPYLLAGGSMGGTIALEVASQLKSRGHEVSSVIMFDTFGPNLAVKERYKQSLYKRLLESILWRSRKLADLIVSKFYRSLDLKLPHKFRYRHIELKNYKLLFSHKAKAYDGRVDLIRAPQMQGVSYEDPFLGWKGVLDIEKLNCYEITGTHENIVESKELPQKVEDILRDISS